MGKKLYLVRHGETRFNVEHRVQGWCDSPLTARGRELLPAVWRRLVGLGARPYGGDPDPGYEPRGARARACREPWGANYNFLRAVYPAAKEELARGWGNCLVLVFDFEDGVFSFEQAIRLE